MAYVEHVRLLHLYDTQETCHVWYTVYERRRTEWLATIRVQDVLETVAVWRNLPKLRRAENCD
jgi:hypothetical protein